MSHIYDAIVLICDGVPDSVGDIFPSLSCWTLASGGTPVRVGSAVIGWAWVRSNMTDQTVRADLHIDDAQLQSNNISMATLLTLTPSVVGTIHLRVKNIITHCTVREIALEGSQNADRRILALDGQINAGGATMGPLPGASSTPAAGPNPIVTKAPAGTPPGSYITHAARPLGQVVTGRIYPTGGLIQTPLDSAPKPKNAPCLLCGRELSSTLDTYYGQNPNGSKFCSPCRYKRKIE